MRHLPNVIDRSATPPGIPGCLWILRFDGSGCASSGDAADLDNLGAASEEGFLWLHMDLTDVRARPLIARLAALPDAAQGALCEPLDHQYLEYSESVICGALLDRERALSGPTSRTDYLRFAIGERFLVTARKRPMSSIDATRSAIDRGARIESPLMLFETLAGFLLDELLDITSQVNAVLDRTEDLIIDGRGREARALLGYARRDAVRLSRQIGGLASTLSRLEKTAGLTDGDQECAEVAARLTQHMEALKQEMQNVQDRARLFQDELNAILNLETNDRLYVLTVVTTLLLPATFVTGFFGMNLKNLPFSEEDMGVVYVTIACALASGAVLLVMRRMGLTNPREEESRPGASQTPPNPADTSL
jgi:zinc transporter